MVWILSITPFLFLRRKTLREITRRQLKSIQYMFREKDLRRKKQEERFLHRAPSGDARKREPLIRLMAEKAEIMLIISSFVHPPAKPGLIDRFLVIAEAENIEPIIIFNKADLLPDRTEGESLALRYRSLGYNALLTSTVTGEGIAHVRSCIAGRGSLLAGHSGVGKSSMLNAIAPGLDAKPAVGEVSTSTGKGTHTTTSVRIYNLGGDTRVFDLPGMKDVSLGSVPPETVANAFPEFQGWARQCRFDDCLHRGEPGCGVLKGAEEGMIAKERYESYLRIIESIS
jgi:ribosome biogenesis GTPase